VERAFIFVVVIIFVLVFVAIGVGVFEIWNADNGKEEVKVVKNDGVKGTITAIIAVSDTN